MVAFLALRFPLGQGRSGRALLVHLAAALTLAASATLAEYSLARTSFVLSPSTIQEAGPEGLPLPVVGGPWPGGPPPAFGEVHFHGGPLFPGAPPGTVVSGETARAIPAPGSFPPAPASPDGGAIVPAPSSSVMVSTSGHLAGGALFVFLSQLSRYAILAGLVLGVGLYGHARRQQAEAERYQRQLVQAQLAALRLQLQPHFLFNTLHSIVTLMPRDVDAARRMVHGLAGLLRATLDVTKRDTLPLREELALVERYLDIERLRFGDRLHVTLDVPDELREAPVPSFCLQPLVENAIRHGIAAVDGRGEIRVTARQDGDALLVEVADNGPGIEEDVALGVGLQNARDRLAQLFGDAGRIELTASAWGGALVRLSLPWNPQHRSNSRPTAKP